MKILHINCNYVGTALHRVMIRHLTAPGVENTVFCPISSQAEKDAFQAQANEHIAVCFRRHDRILYFLKQKKIISAAQAAVEVSDCDVIHAYTLMTDGNTARTLAKKYKKPYFVAVRDTDVNSFFRLKPYLRPLGVRIMRDASAVFFLSEAYRTEVLEHIVPERYRAEIAEKTHVVPNGIDSFWLEHRYTERDISAARERFAQKQLRAVCVGRINKRKNIPAVQAALASLREAGWTTSLTVIGKTEDAEELERIRADECTVCLPPTDQRGLIDHYRNADVFVLASHTETFGLVYAEAMSQALPVVYTRGQGFDGQFSEGEVGYSVSDRDPAEIADAIERVCADYERLSANAVERCLRFNWDQICESYRMLYRQTLEG